MEYRGNGINPIVIVTNEGVSKVGTPTFVFGFYGRITEIELRVFIHKGTITLRSSFGDPSVKVQSGNGVVSEW